jgi:hypothetical protein
MSVPQKPSYAPPLFHLAFSDVITVDAALGEQPIKPVADDLDDQSLRQRLAFDRLMRSAILEPPVRFDDRRQIVLGHLIGREGQTLPVERAIAF